MTKFFEHQGRQFMKVEPAQFLYNSTLISNVINRGDVFAVDLNTGELTVVKYTPDELKLVLLSEGSQPRTFDNHLALKTAIIEEFAKGRKYPVVQVSFGLNRTAAVSEGSKAAFLQMVAKAIESVTKPAK